MIFFFDHDVPEVSFGVESRKQGITIGKCSYAR